MTDDVLIYGDTERSAALRHEIPLAIGDPFLYAETGGRRVVLTNALERDRLARAVPDAELVLADELGMDELIAAGLPRAEIELELCARLCARLDLRTVLVPPELPVALADRLRADGIELRPDAAEFDARRHLELGLAAGHAVAHQLGVPEVVREHQARARQLALDSALLERVRDDHGRGAVVASDEQERIADRKRHLVAQRRRALGVAVDEERAHARKVHGRGGRR